MYKSWLYDWEIKIIDFPVAKVRSVVSGTTGSLVNAIGNITITGHKSYLLMNVDCPQRGGLDYILIVHLELMMRLGVWV